MRPSKLTIPPRYVPPSPYSVRALMSENDRLRVSLKQMQSEANQERTLRMQLAKERQVLSGERETLMRERDVLLERLKGQLRDQREKE